MAIAWSRISSKVIVHPPYAEAACSRSRHSSLFAIESFDDIYSAAKRREAFLQGLAGRIDPQRGDAGVAPGPYALAYHRLCAHHGGLQHHRVRNDSRSILTSSCYPQPLYLGSHVSPALPAVGIVVKIGGR